MKTEEDLDESIQRILDRLIFIRVCEDKELEPNTLLSKLREWKVGRGGKPFYQFLNETFRGFDTIYDSKLFAEHTCDKLEIEDIVLGRIIPQLYESDDGIQYDLSAIDADVLGTIYEQYLGFILRQHKKVAKVVAGYAQRKKMGIYYTPRYIVDFIVKNTVERWLNENHRGTITILDAACGSGSFLIRALAALIGANPTDTFEHRISILRNSIFGVDLDPKATEIAQLNLLLAVLERKKLLPMLDNNIRYGNSLIEDRSYDERALDWKHDFGEIMSKGGFDIIIGNPPYIDSEEMTKTQPQQREYLTNCGIYMSAKGNWDIFCLFLERALQLLRPGGYLGMIVPNKLLSADYANVTRELLGKYRIQAIRNYSRIPVFSASVYPIVIIVKKEKPTNDHKVLVEIAKAANDIPKVHTVGEIRQTEMLEFETWSHILERGAIEIIRKIKTNARLLGEMCEVHGAATVSESYEIAKHIQEFSKRHSSYFKFINTGTIDPYVSLFGRKRTAVGERYDKPIILKPLLFANFENRAREAERSKIIIGGMNKRLECFLDEKGEYLAGKSTTIVMSNQVNLKVILAILNSKLITYWYKVTFKSLSLAGGFMRVGPPQIRRVPIRAWSNEEGEIIKCVDMVTALDSEIKEVGEGSDRAREKIKKMHEIMDEIDKIIYELYGLSQHEMKMIEESSSFYQDSA